MCNKLCAVIHDALDRRIVQYEVDRDDFCWQHQYIGGTDIGPLETDIFPLGISLRHFLDTHVLQDTLRSANAAWTPANRMYWRINNK